MHASRPYGRFADSAELSPDDARAVEWLARSVTNIKQTSGLDSLKRVIDLPGGGTAEAVDMGGTFRIYITTRSGKKVNTDSRESGAIPMLFSGAVTMARVKEGEGVGVRLTEQTRRRIAGYPTDPSAALPPKDVTLQRFRIEYPGRFAYFASAIGAEYMHTQFERLRPTWWSGAMASVVQIVSGYGRQDLAALPNNAVERAKMPVSAGLAATLQKSAETGRLPAYAGTPDRQGWINYDYRFSRSHGVGFDSDGDPWLLQVSPRGVFAMPLPMIPASTTPAFRSFVESKDDAELLAILDKFGGMPSGESFPEKENEFEAWRRAGAIVRVCDAGDFYSHMAYYPACGWSFNSRGTEAFNTCYNLANSGLMQGYAYKLSIRLTPAENRGRVKPNFAADASLTGPQVALINTYLSSLYEVLGENGARELAIKYKLARQSAADLMMMIGAGRPGRADVDYWDNLEMAPIATHGGSLRRVAAGPIYYPGKNPESMGHLKFPSLDGKGCASFPLVSPDYNGPAVKSDTVIFGCYVADELKVLKYFFDPRKFRMETVSSFEDVMIVGAWEKTTTIGESVLTGLFYTSDFDDRQEVPPTVIHTTLKGIDLGFGGPAFLSPATPLRVGAVYRFRYYAHHTRETTTEGFGNYVAALVPVFERDALLYAYKEVFSSRTLSTKGELHGMKDPNSYQIWTHDNVFHWVDSTESNNQYIGKFPENGLPVWMDTHLYEPTEYSDYADEGNWWGFSGLQDVTYLFGHYTQRQSNYTALGFRWGGEIPGFQPYETKTVAAIRESGKLGVSIALATADRVHENEPHPWFFGFSPELGNFFYRDACRVAFGSAEYSSISETRPDGTRFRWGASDLASPTEGRFFIGVINE